MDIPLKYRQLWSEWEIQVLILLSLTIQITLIFLGRKRRTSTSTWLRGVVWCSYLLADWVADFVLGQLSGAMDESSSSNTIIAFWAPFLILHLSGPDTITAYSIEDNELWARHLLGLGYELGVAFYVLFRALPNTRLLTPTLLIFLVATIKYLERSYSLYKASVEGFRSSSSSFPIMLSTEELNNLIQSFWIYSATKAVFIGMIPPVYWYEKARDVIQEMTTEEVLRVTSMELSFAYDEFYTKAVVIHSKVGYIVRVLCTLCILLSSFLFISAPKNDFENIDIAITYVLVTASACLDFVAIFMLVLSDWMVVSLLSVEKISSWRMWFAECIVKFNIAFHKRRCWSIKMSQLNILDHVLKNFELKKAPQKWIINRKTGSKTYPIQKMQPVEATHEVLEIITSYMQRRSHLEPKEFNKPAGFSALQQVTTISDQAVQKFGLLFEGMPIFQQVLVWHIATELCLHWNPESQHLMHLHQIQMETKKNKLVVERKSSEKEACEYISNYMMHTVIKRPEFISTTWAVNLILLREVLGEMHQFISTISYDHQLLPPNGSLKEVCIKKMIDELDWTTDEHLFVTARVLARLMLVIREEERWGVISTAWVELLIKCGKNSSGRVHLKQLSMGEELLTFVWLFNKHVEIDDAYNQIYSSNCIQKAMALFSEIQPHFQQHDPS